MDFWSWLFITVIFEVWNFLVWIFVGLWSIVSCFCFYSSAGPSLPKIKELTAIVSSTFWKALSFERLILILFFNFINHSREEDLMNGNTKQERTGMESFLFRSDPWIIFLSGNQSLMCLTPVGRNEITCDMYVKRW